MNQASTRSYQERVHEWTEKMEDFLIEKVFGKNYGHCIERHLNISDKELMHRSAKEHVDCSSFIGDYNVILNSINESILMDTEAIAEWMATFDDSEEWVVYGKIPEGCSGRGFLSKNHDWNDGARIYTTYVAVLKKNQHDEFYIASVYPYPVDL